MKKHVMAITYEPKKDAIFDGRCTQTIRKGDKVSKGDEILFHDWEGLPYRSKWSQRKRITVTKVINIYIKNIGMGMPWQGWIEWNKPWINTLAKFDYIDPPTGIALRDVLFGLNGAPKEPEQYQIIRWGCIGATESQPAGKRPELTSLLKRGEHD